MAESVHLRFQDLLRADPKNFVLDSLEAWTSLQPDAFVIDCSRISNCNASVAAKLFEFQQATAQIAAVHLTGLSPQGAALLRLLGLDFFLIFGLKPNTVPLEI